MPISLSKGGRVSLTPTAGPPDALDAIRVGIGWDPSDTGTPVDLDLSVLLLDDSGLVSSDDDFVFYGNLTHVSGAVVHLGDNLDGAGDGDDEVVAVRLRDLPTHVERLLVLVSIHEAARRGFHFGLVSSAFVRVVDDQSGTDLARFDLTGGAAGEDCLAFAELYRDETGWGFAAVGEYHDGGLEGVLAVYGVVTD